MRTRTAAEQYERWEWLVLHVGDRLLLTTDETVSAVELPSRIAGEVQRYLTDRTGAGPVITLPSGPSRSIVLSGSADDAAPVDLIRLIARGGRTHRRGTLIPLPPSRLEYGQVNWLCPPGPPAPEGPELPPFTAVVAATRAVTERATAA